MKMKLKTKKAGLFTSFLVAILLLVSVVGPVRAEEPHISTIIEMAGKLQAAKIWLTQVKPGTQALEGLIDTMHIAKNAITSSRIKDGSIKAEDVDVDSLGKEFLKLSGGTMEGDIDMDSNLVINIGDPGTDFTATGGLTLADGLIVDAGDSRFDENVVIGGSTSATETLDNTGFVMDGDDLFVAGMLGVEGVIYSDVGLTVGASTTYADGSITDSAGDFTFTLGDAGDDLIIATGNVLIGSGTPGVALDGEDLFVTGGVEVDGAVNLDSTLEVDGATTLNGAVTLGDAIADDIAFNGQVTTDIIPDDNAVQSLGEPTNAWEEAYISDSILMGPNQEISIDWDAGNGVLEFNDDTVSIGQYAALHVGDIGDLYIEDDFEVADTAHLAGTVELGDANSDDIFFYGEVKSNIIPDDNDTYSLGSPSNVWQNLYIGDDTIFIGNNQDVHLDYNEAGQNRLEITGPNSDVWIEDSLEVNDDFEVNDDSEFDGDVDLGNGSGDNITINGQVDSNILADADSTYDIGTAGTRWSTIYADTVNFLSALTDASTTTSTISFGDAGNATITIGDDAVNDGINITGNTAITDGQWSVTNAGAATLASLDLNGVFDVAGATVTGDIIPSATTYDLGSTAAEFASMYVGDTTGIYFGADQDTHLFYNTGSDELELSTTTADFYVNTKLSVANEAYFDSTGGSSGLADFNVDGYAEFNGSVELGDAGADDIIFNGNVASDVIPDADITRDLGSSSARWSEGYFNYLYFDDTTGTDNAIVFGTSDDVRIKFDGTADALEITDNVVSIGGGAGDTATGDGDLYVQDDFEVDGAANLDGNLDVAMAATFSGSFEMPNGTVLPGSCSTGQMFLDSDSDDCANTGAGNGALCVCNGGSWVLLQDL